MSISLHFGRHGCRASDVNRWATAMRALPVLALVGLCAGSCGPATDSVKSSTAKSVLDQLLTPVDVQSRIRVVEQDLATDEWTVGPESRPGHHNISRSGRESNLALELLGQLKPRLKGMTSQQLLESLKTYPDGPSPSFPGVAYYVYRDGNHFIIEELSHRTASEVRLLHPLRNDSRGIFTGDNGPPLSVGELVRFTLLHEPM